MSAKAKSVDLLVIGGGINGAAVARDAAGRGLSVVLAERNDYASATSSASSNLIHGGLRYLEQFAISMVRDSLDEREVLTRIAPHLVAPQTFLVPVTAEQKRPAWLVRLGLVFYDLIGRRASFPRSGRLTADQVSSVPTLRKEHLQAVLHYPDCQTDDVRLVLATLLDARARGADVANRRAVTHICTEEHGFRVHLDEEGVGREVRARFVVNAAGAWAADVSRMAAPLAETPKLRLIRGSHIVLRMPEPAFVTAFTLQQPDGRVVFALPWLRGRYLVVGTTEVPHFGSATDASCSDEEAAYLLECYNRYFMHPGGAVASGDIVWSWSGLRVLSDASEDNPTRMRREAELHLLRNGEGALLTIYGGKLTTHRSLAEKVLDKLIECGAGAGPAWTAEAPVHGGAWTRAQLEDWVSAAGNGDDAGLRARWAFTYGSEAEAVYRAYSTSGPASRNIVSGIHEAELRHAVYVEDARNGEDFLWRRTKLFIDLTQKEKDRIEEWFAKYA